jgi:DNA-directed RNA polymerase subunit RPC12/RpoP
MGIFGKLFGRKKTEDKTEDSLREQLWAASPQSTCGVCGKQLRGLSGGVLVGSGMDFLETMMEGARYVCPKCGFQSCFQCCADTTVHKVICKRCGSEMSRG